MSADPEFMQGLIVAAVVGRTDLEERFYQPKTWSTRPDRMPVGLVRYAGTQRRSLGKGEVQFEAVDTMQIVLQVAQLAAGDDSAILAAEVEAWRIQKQVEVAIFSTGKLYGQVEQFPFINTTIARNSDAQQTIVEVRTELGLKYYQGPEDLGLLLDGEIIAQQPLPDLEEVRIDAMQGEDAAGAATGPVASVVTVG